MPDVQLPNGQMLSFPDDMSETQMRDAIIKNFPEYAPQEQKPEPTIGQQAGNILAGAFQGAAKLGQGLGEAEVGLVNKLLGTQLQAPPADVYGATGTQRTTPAAFAEYVTQAGATGLGGGALTAASRAPALAPALFAALTQTGGAKERAKTAAISGALGGAVKYAPLAAQKLSGQFGAKGLAKRILKARDNQKNISKSLYDAAFENTDRLKPRISANTAEMMSDLKSERGIAELKSSIRKLAREPSAKKLHAVRKDIGAKLRYLENRGDRIGLGGDELDLQDKLTTLQRYLDNDLDKTLSQASPEKYEAFRAAQNFYRENVVPFRKYPSLRKLLSEDQEISGRLITDMSRDANAAKKLRELTGYNPKIAKAAKTVGVSAALPHIATLAKILRTL